MNDKRKIEYADDDYESIRTLIKLRAPALLLGLVLAIGISLITSSFREVLAKNVQVAFFLPFIVYIAAAIGTQTEAIYSRDLKTGKAKFINYVHKEMGLGILFGAVFGLLSGLFAHVWLADKQLSLSVTLATFLAIAAAPLVALLVTQAFQSFREDPAAGSGPIATVIQDMISILIYGIVCSMILL